MGSAPAERSDETSPWSEYARSAAQTSQRPATISLMRDTERRFARSRMEPTHLNLVSNLHAFTPLYLLTRSTSISDGTTCWYVVIGKPKSGRFIRLQLPPFLCSPKPAKNTSSGGVAQSQELSSQHSAELEDLEESCQLNSLKEYGLQDHKLGSPLWLQARFIYYSQVQIGRHLLSA